MNVQNIIKQKDRDRKRLKHVRKHFEKLRSNQIKLNEVFENEGN